MENLSSRRPARVTGYIQLITTISFTVLVIVGLTLNLAERSEYPQFPDDYFDPEFIVLGFFGLLICLETVLSTLLLKATKWDTEPKKSLKRLSWWIFVNVIILVLVGLAALVWTTYILIIILLVRVVMFGFVWHYKKELTRYCFENPSKPLSTAQDKIAKI